eukprot:gnl/MRDRNA2_/MRDRNA2_17472_c0_seq1.p1 gnl/MRDRNA2_/MRDRNA2_17472_c0~~gnl/MRDRNA2_/MRDRNA2_17472_c0_seq1.p1  ORF type:complete len:430 (+),score=120.47 gnl/MRDRNA2_/MRDRNA2_17472_c0_seq1:78-1367(+)
MRATLGASRRIVRQLAIRNAVVQHLDAANLGAGQRQIRASSSSFIRQVMEQVKKEAESNESLKKDFERLEKSTQRIKEQTSKLKTEDKMAEASEKIKDAASKTSDLFTAWKEKASSTASRTSEKFNEATAENENLRKAREFISEKYEDAPPVFKNVRGVFNNVVDKASALVNNVGDEKASRLKDWKDARESAASFAEQQEANKKAREEAMAKGEEAPPEMEAPSALVVSKAHNSSWDRFGAGLQDMPLLNNVFNNPLFDRMFGESEIAASIREMKEIDPTFRMAEFQEELEEVVAPHIVKMYLQGKPETLEVHCGQAAFAAVNASIQARKKERLYLDDSILSGPNEVELKGAKLMEHGAPYFIWTFQTQQVNCLRDHEGEIVEGAIDDIRSVFYMVAITRHPELEKVKTKLEYPWQIEEIAILGNQPCF